MGAKCCKQNPPSAAMENKQPANWKSLTSTEWADRLPQETFQVARKGQTEAPFSGKYVKHKGDGTYCCNCCGTGLFKSNAKYDSGSGWPSFYQALDEDKIIRRVDRSHGMHRTEVLCSTCNAHLGHVFNDGPDPKGERFCVNSVCLRFQPKKEGN